MTAKPTAQEIEKLKADCFKAVGDDQAFKLASKRYYIALIDSFNDGCDIRNIIGSFVGDIK